MGIATDAGRSAGRGAVQGAEAQLQEDLEAYKVALTDNALDKVDHFEGKIEQHLPGLVPILRELHAGGKLQDVIDNARQERESREAEAQRLAAIHGEYLDGKPPAKEVLRAVVQWAGVGIPYFAGVALAYFPMSQLVGRYAKPMTSPLGEWPTKHEDQYIEAGSSGNWEYWGVSQKWLKPWSCWEDGELGEPSGRWSSLVKGKERTPKAIAKWARRNPFNWAKRTSKFFACRPNDCFITWWGTGDVSNRGVVTPGWYFIKAVDKKTGSKYYGFRLVHKWSDKASLNSVLGYKLKPSHATEIQGNGDEDKAITFRTTPYSKA